MKKNVWSDVLIKGFLDNQLCVITSALQDPQQRLLMECGSEVLISARTLQQPTGSTAGDPASPGVSVMGYDADKCGVYVGVSSVDYMKLCMMYNRTATVYSATGPLNSAYLSHLSMLCRI
jgi:acyl transferase domain-containing protein